MPSELIIALLVLFGIAILVQAYQMGWHAGHDVHHDDSVHGRVSEDEPGIWK